MPETYEVRTFDVRLQGHVETSTAEFQRMIGQLETYARWGVQIVVLIVGQIDNDLEKRIEERLLTDWDDEESARVVHIAVPNVPT